MGEGELDGDAQHVVGELLNEFLSEVGGCATGATIFRVPSILRERDEIAYIPELLSVGPYHHRKLPLTSCNQQDKKRKEMELVKLRYLHDLQQRASRYNTVFLLNCSRTVIRRAEELAAKYEVHVDIRLPPDPNGNGLDAWSEGNPCRPVSRIQDPLGQLCGRPSQALTNSLSMACQESPKGINLQRDDFVKMMVLDGCFIVEFLIKWYLGEIQAGALNVQLSVVRTDLLRVENQIPFFLLEKFFEEAGLYRNDGHGLPLPSLRVIALAYLSDDRQLSADELAIDQHDDSEFHHLLHLYHSTCLQPANIEPINKRMAATGPQVIRKTNNHVDALCLAERSLIGFLAWSFRQLLQPFYWLLRLIFGIVGEILLRAIVFLYLTGSNYPLPRYINGRNRRFLSGIPNACYLRDTGFELKEKDPLSSFSYVTRKEKTIEIPTLSSDLTPPNLLKNLVAYEHCSLPPASVISSARQEQSVDTSARQKPISALARLMGRLVHTTEDVAFLRERGILDKRFSACDDQTLVSFFEGLRTLIVTGGDNAYNTAPGSDDEKLVTFFKNLAAVPLTEKENYLQTPVLDYVMNYYIDKDYLVKFYLWRKKLIPDYFSNPWAIPSTVVATIVLTLTALSAFFNIYNRYHPHH